MQVTFVAPVKTGTGIAPTASPKTNEYDVAWDQEHALIVLTHKQSQITCRVPMSNVLSFVEAPPKTEKKDPTKK